MLVINREGLRRAILDAEISQAELSRRADLSPRVVSELLNKDLRFVRLKTLSKLRRVLECSLHQLILGDINRNEIKQI